MITALGFQRPSFEEILEDIQDNFTGKFNDGGANSPSLEPEDILGALSNILATSIDNLYRVAEDTYYGRYLTTATGVSLDRTAAPTVRRPAIKAETHLVFTGDPTTVIGISLEYETELGVRYILKAPVTLDGGGDGDGDAIAVVAGTAGNTAIGAIRFITVPLTGLDTVTNDTIATGGLEIESDDDFRVRAISDREADLTSSLPAIVNRVLEISGVGAAIGFENTENVIVDGRPPGSVEIVVRGGADADIALVIFNTKAAGVETHGTESEVVIDEAGNSHTIEFSRVTDIETWVEVTLVTNGDYNPSVSNDIIRQRILDYIGGVNPDTVTSPGANIAENIFSWKCEAVAFELNSPDAIPGIESISVLIDTVASPIDETEIVIAATEEAFTSFGNIVGLPTP